MFPLPPANPDPRLMERLAWRLRGTSSAATFIAGGEALATALMQPSRARWADEVADGMVGALLLVQDATMDQADADERIALSVAAAVLSVARPRTAGACDAAISIWMAWGMGAPRCLTRRRSLAGRTLLALFRDDPDDAADAVTALLDIDGDGIGLILHDWTAARVQQLGADRERACFHNLCVAAHNGDADPALLILAALVMWTLDGPRRCHLLDWIDDQAGRAVPQRDYNVHIVPSETRVNR